MPSSKDLFPVGVELIALDPHLDSRGVFTEIFRANWRDGVHPRQWNLVRSEENVLRGFHAHWRHSDYLLMVSGSMHLGLKDLRYRSPSFGQSAQTLLDSRAPTAILIPPGVGHAFYFPEPSVHVYAVSDYWDPADEVGCRWDDPDLNIDWGFDNPILSSRDERLPNLDTLLAVINRRLSQESNAG